MDVGRGRALIISIHKPTDTLKDVVLLCRLVEATYETDRESILRDFATISDEVNRHGVELLWGLILLHCSLEFEFAVHDAVAEEFRGLVEIDSHIKLVFIALSIDLWQSF